MKIVLSGLVALGLASSALAQPASLYSQDFESGPLGPEWSANSYLTAGVPAFTTFNGRYSSGYTILTLPQPALPGGLDGSGGGGGGGGSGGGDGPSGGGGGGGGGSYSLRYAVTFDLYCIDSWDGGNNVHGQDRFQLDINGATVFDETIGNQPGSSQSFRPADVGPTHLGFAGNWLDSIYRQITVPFTVPAGVPLDIVWNDGGLQGLADESWGIDNVNITYEIVPAPGALALLGAGLLLTRRKR